MNERYSHFVAEGFLGSIRSVLIVDDDYPTIDEILRDQELRNQNQEVRTDKEWPSRPTALRTVIETFRKRNPPLLVDIHDGQNVEQESEESVVKHLHQSDLLILDYQLDKARPQDGRRAIQILGKLMQNDHFNLVVIYTNEPLDVVFVEMLLGLLAPCFQNPANGLPVEILERIREAEDEHPDILTRFHQIIGVSEYLHSRRSIDEFLRAMCRGDRGYEQFTEYCELAVIHPARRRELLMYLLSEFERSLLREGKVNSVAPNDSLVWSNGSVRWLKSNSIFVAFSDKSKAHDLLDQLHTALCDWNPNPSRLFLAKIRASMDEYGAVAQTEALTHRYALAGWFMDLMLSEKSERKSKIVESVHRHSDQLMDVILPPVVDFANQLIDAESESGEVEERCLAHFGVNPSEANDQRRAALEHNALVCSRSPTGWHLNTGHIFVMADEYWLCLSAACDMVPTQLPDWRKDSFGSRLPFIAVKLHTRSNMPQNVHSNLYLFVRIEGQVQVFSFNESGRQESKPHWEFFLADNAGEFVDGDLSLSIWRTEKSGDAVEESSTGTPDLVMTSNEATVVSQLRYEYALNLNQKLGASLTRIGLDFSEGIRRE
ncbi:MAG: response regulator receiver domain [Candidatus Poribacteria bacterium]|nr:response regulator receiver domain [Candidatus Poribacteria bacterium]